MDAGQLSESFKYDKHGNIKEVTRFGEDDVIDLLTLSYHGNQLKKVIKRVPVTCTIKKSIRIRQTKLKNSLMMPMETW